VNYVYKTSEIEKHLARVIKKPRQPVGDLLCSHLALFGDIFEENKLSHSVRPAFVRWALEGRVHVVVGWSLCRATPESARALRAVMLVATSIEPFGYSYVTGYATLIHRKFYGWVAVELFGAKNQNPKNIITQEDAVFLAAVAVINHNLLWQYRDKLRNNNQGGAFAVFARARLKRLAVKYERVLRARGIV